MDTRVTVATINVHGRKDRWPERRHLLVAQLIESRADLIGLQEIFPPIRQADWLCKQINVRISGTEKTPYQVLQKRNLGPVSGFSCGVAVLSRLPVLYHESLGLAYGGRVALRVHVELPSHQTMDFVTTELHDVPYEVEARHDQAMKLMGWLHGHKRVPIQVVVGNLNETTDGMAVKHVKQSFRSAYEASYGREPLATYPTTLPADMPDLATCNDYIFASTAVRRISNVGIFCDEHASDDNTLYPSDHVGLLATLEV